MSAFVRLCLFWVLSFAWMLTTSSVVAQPVAAAGADAELRSLRVEIQELRTLVRSLELTIATGLKRLELLRATEQANRLASDKQDLEQSLESVREERSTADPESISKLNEQESHLMSDLSQTNLRLEEATRSAMELQNEIARLGREWIAQNASSGAKPDIANLKP